MWNTYVDHYRKDTEWLFKSSKKDNTFINKKYQPSPTLSKRIYSRLGYAKHSYKNSHSKFMITSKDLQWKISGTENL